MGVYELRMNIYSHRTLAWKIPWTEEPGGLRSMGSLRVGHDWATSLSLFTFMHWRRKWQPTPVFLPGETRDGGDWWAAVYGVAQSRTRLKRLSSSRYCWDTWEGGESSTCLCYCSLPVAHKHFQGFPNLWYSGHSSMTILCNFRLYPVYTIFQMITKLTLFIYPRMRIRRRQWHPTPVLLPGKSHGQRSLVGCSPWGR